MGFFEKKAVAAALGVAVAAMPLSAQEASASAAAPFTPQGVCGAGFKKVSETGVQASDPPGSPVIGNVYLLYRSATREYCAVTMKTASPRAAARMRVGLGTMTRALLSMQEMTGRYKRYIGPLKLRTNVKCIRYSGMIQLPGEDPVVGQDRFGSCPGGTPTRSKRVGKKARGV
ncbi:hypothetical protein [Planomonospora venezuelensis]|uniref:Uncharacterized protein n=1 Tax=Planomonospora venezuelensis TaxID=1999 RepID=A0A841D7S7_PLAVE|nr:hypothetical protein [Planomonospora venezuelensis]MBB5966682.1 hypothetical protein [Planomonospora venezuelensis]